VTKGDVTVILVALCLVALIWAGIYLFPRDTDQMRAVVRVDGEEILSIPVGGVKIQTKTVSVQGGQAIIEYGQGKVRVSQESDGICPDDICWRTGWISRTGQTIACVPNRMTVTLMGGTGIDAVVR
jgi:hypothetical protein